MLILGPIFPNISRFSKSRFYTIFASLDRQYVFTPNSIRTLLFLKIIRVNLVPQIMFRIGFPFGHDVAVQFFVVQISDVYFTGGLKILVSIVGSIRIQRYKQTLQTLRFQKPTEFCRHYYCLCPFVGCSIPLMQCPALWITIFMNIYRTLFEFLGEKCEARSVWIINERFSK